MRLIDADALLDKAQLAYRIALSEDDISTGKYSNVEFTDNFAVDQDDIVDAATVDAVQVVRKPVKGYEGYYEVDNLARVFSISRTIHVSDNGREYEKPVNGKKLKQGVHSKGYKIVGLTKNGTTKTVFVHRIVAEAFLPNETRLPMVNHIDEDKTNNLPENLEWCTASYNRMYGNADKKHTKKIIGIPHTAEHNEKISQSLKKYFCSYGEKEAT